MPSSRLAASLLAGQWASQESEACCASRRVLLRCFETRAAARPRWILLAALFRLATGIILRARSVGDGRATEGKSADTKNIPFGVTVRLKWGFRCVERTGNVRFRQVNNVCTLPLAGRKMTVFAPGMSCRQWIHGALPSSSSPPLTFAEQCA